MDKTHGCELLDRYRDGELDGSQREGFKRHLAVCEYCRTRMALLDNVVSALRRETVQTVDLADRIARRAFGQVAALAADASWDGLLASWFRPRLAFLAFGTTLVLCALLWFAPGVGQAKEYEYEKLLNQADAANLAETLLTSSDTEFALTLVQGGGVW
ncbi:MAG: zf-HC2 domain-containing protein [Acidobacteriota bacterium]|jgi:anti-sigma factor RsiW|nr:zf-HC2 domain-containing protein [Acidobacteriota bacterium]